MIERLAGAIAWRLLVGGAYTAGLTLLIPWVLLRVLPPDLRVVSAGTPPLILWVGLGLVGLAFVIRLGVSQSLGATFTTLGRLTFVPGGVGILVWAFGRERILGYMARTVPRFDELRGVVELYLDRAVPQVLYLAVGFFVLGAALLTLGSRLTRRR